MLSWLSASPVTRIKEKAWKAAGWENMPPRMAGNKKRHSPNKC